MEGPEKDKSNPHEEEEELCEGGDEVMQRQLEHERHYTEEEDELCEGGDEVMQRQLEHDRHYTEEEEELCEGGDEAMQRQLEHDRHYTEEEEELCEGGDEAVQRQLEHDRHYTEEEEELCEGGDEVMQRQLEHERDHVEEEDELCEGGDEVMQRQLEHERHYPEEEEELCEGGDQVMQRQLEHERDHVEEEEELCEGDEVMQRQLEHERDHVEEEDEHFEGRYNENVSYGDESKGNNEADGPKEEQFSHEVNKRSLKEESDDGDHGIAKRLSEKEEEEWMKQKEGVGESESIAYEVEGSNPVTDDDELSLFKSLFDLSTVQGLDTGHKVVQSELVSIPRITFSGKTVRFASDTMLSYYEVDSSPKKKVLQTSTSDCSLKLSIPKGCGRDSRFTEHYCVPSLRLETVEDKEYIEPIRDREKVWTLDSQRDMLIGETHEERRKENKALKLGLYPKLPPNPALKWSPALQTLLRKRRITRSAMVISDTHCFVDIYGVGVSGRVLAPGSQTSRLLLIEAYSVWDSTTYSMQLAVPLLKHLLAGQEHLFQPGKKMALMKALLRLLYFEYSISYDEERVLVPASGAGTSAPSRSAPTSRRSSVSSSGGNVDQRPSSSASTGKLSAENGGDCDVGCESRTSKQRRPSGDSEASCKDRTSEPSSSVVTHTIRVTHLDKFRLPDTFPQTIADIIRVNSTRNELLDMNCPRLTQHLKISRVVRENGPVVRRREAEERARQLALDEERKRKAWAAIPKRLKGLFASACRRKYGKWVIMSLYRMPKKPSVLVIKGFCPIECVEIPHFLDLKHLGKVYGVKTPPSMWTDETVRQVLRSAALQLQVMEGDDRLALFVAHPISAGPATQLGPLKSCFGFERRRSVMLARSRALPARDAVIPDWPLYEDRQYSPNVPKIAARSQKQRRLYTGDTPNNHLKHRRDIGRKGLRISQRARKIGHAYGICSVYLTSKMNTSHISSLEQMELDISQHKKYGNMAVPPELAPEFEISMVIYFPHNPTHLARTSGAPISFGSESPSGPSVVQFLLHRRDLCRLVSDKALLRHCLRLGHGFSYETASDEETVAMEAAWDELIGTLLKKCRWRQGNCGNSSSSGGDQETSSGDDSMHDALGYTDKLRLAMELMSVSARDVTAEELPASPAKMKTPLPRMQGPPRPPETKDELVDPFAEDYVGEAVDFSEVVGGGTEVSSVGQEDSSLEELSDHEDSHNRSEEMVLCLPVVIFSRTCRVCSEASRRPDVYLQLFVWQRGDRLGVVAFDHDLRDVYFAQPNESQQSILCEELESAGATELSINMSVFVMSMVYEEVEVDEHSAEGRMVSIEESTDEESEDGSKRRRTIRVKGSLRMSEEEAVDGFVEDEHGEGEEEGENEEDENESSNYRDTSLSQSNTHYDSSENDSDDDEDSRSALSDGLS